MFSGAREMVEFCAFFVIVKAFGSDVEANLNVHVLRFGSFLLHR